MKVIEDRPDRLVIREVPWLLGLAIGAGALFAFVLAALLPAPIAGIGALLIGLLFAGTGIVHLARFTLTLDRRARTATIEIRTLLRRYRERLPLDTIRSAEICARSETSESYSRDETGLHRITHARHVDRPTLILADGTERVFARQARGAAPFVHRINRWLGLSLPDPRA